MKTISFKISDEMFERIEKYRKINNLNRTSYVNEAIETYTRVKEREDLHKKLRKEAKAIEKGSKQIIEEWDTTVGDGLDNI